MKRWQISRSALRPRIPFGVFRRRIKRQVDALESSPLFDRTYYLQEAQAAGVSVSSKRAVWHYVTVGDKLRLKPHRLFDTHYYHDVYGDIEKSAVSALYHFITHGALENRNPHPAFDTSYVRLQITNNENPLVAYLSASSGTIKPHRMFDEIFVLDQLGNDHDAAHTVLERYFEADLSIEPCRQFNARQYLARYPSIEDLHPFYHYVRWGIKEKRVITGNYTNIDNILSAVEAMDNIDFDVLKPWQSVDDIGRLSRIHMDSPEEAALRKLLLACGDQKHIFVVIMNNLVTGGAEKVTANVINAMSAIAQIESVLIVVTSHGSNEALKWIDCNISKVVDVSDEFNVTSDNSAAMMLASFIRIIEAQSVFVVNSRQGWALVERHGKVLMRTCNVNVACFCYDYDNYGRRAGYARTHLPYALPGITHVVTDNSAFKEKLIVDLRLSQDDARKIEVLYQPIKIENSTRKELLAKGRRRRVLWAGRFSHQKRLTLALDVAKSMPDVDFVFAGGDLSDAGLPSGQIEPNISIFGKFKNISELSLTDFDAFLYTSKWDGLPNVLLEVAAFGVPIVASNVGGISELISEKTGWLVENHSEPAAYKQSLEDLFSHHGANLNKIEGMMSILESRHSFDEFCSSVSKIFLNENV